MSALVIAIFLPFPYRWLTIIGVALNWFSGDRFSLELMDNKYILLLSLDALKGWARFLQRTNRAHLNKYRHTLWEIHPITAIEVLDGGRWKSVDTQ